MSVSTSQLRLTRMKAGDLQGFRHFHFVLGFSGNSNRQPVNQCWHNVVCQMVQELAHSVDSSLACRAVPRQQRLCRPARPMAARLRSTKNRVGEFPFGLQQAKRISARSNSCWCAEETREGQFSTRHNANGQGNFQADRRVQSLPRRETRPPARYIKQLPPCWRCHGRNQVDKP